MEQEINWLYYDYSFFILFMTSSSGIQLSPVIQQ